MKNLQRGSVSLLAMVFTSFLLSLGGVGAATAYFQKNPNEFMDQLHAYFQTSVHAANFAPLDSDPTPTTTPTPTPAETVTPTPTAGATPEDTVTPTPSITGKPSIHIGGELDDEDGEEQLHESTNAKIHEHDSRVGAGATVGFHTEIDD